MIKASIKSLLLFLWILLFMVLVWLVKKTKKKDWYQSFCSFGSTVLCFIIGVKIQVEGEVTTVRPLLLVSNHISYLDILILGCKTPVLFTPKIEMAKWPIIGSVCRLINCVFIDRRPEKLKESSDKILNALARGEALSLFPEGTTGNGRHILPFKSSFFAIAEKKINMEGGGEHELFIQPAIISYTKIGSLPIDSTQWPLIAWYGDMEFTSHVFQLLKLTRIDAKLTLLPAVTISEFANRKTLSVHCYNAAVEVLQSRN